MIEDKDVVEAGRQAIQDVRAHRMRDYYQPGESGIGQLYTIAHDARLSFPDEEPSGDGRYLDPVENEYFMLMDDIKTDRVLELLHSRSYWGTGTEAHVQNDGDWEPGVDEEYLYIDDPRLRMPVEFNDEAYVPLALMDLSTEGSILIGRTGRIYPFTVELNPDVYLEERHRPGEGTKTRNARNMSAVDLWEEDAGELEQLRRFPEAQHGHVDAVYEGGVHERRYPSDLVLLTLSSETGKIKRFADGREVMTSSAVTSYTSPEEVWAEARQQNELDEIAQQDASIQISDEVEELVTPLVVADD